MWIITRLVQDFVGKYTVYLEQEVQKYGTANREQNSTSSFFVDNQVIIAQDKVDTEYKTKILI
jgi:hypothetical protein